MTLPSWWQSRSKKMARDGLHGVNSSARLHRILKDCCISGQETPSQQHRPSSLPDIESSTSRATAQPQE